MKKRKRRLLFSSTIIVVLLFSFSNLFIPDPPGRDASPGFTAENRRLLSRNPPGLKLTLKPHGRKFTIGEEIKVSLVFAGMSKDGTKIYRMRGENEYDRSGRPDFNRFIVDGPSPDSWTDPIAAWSLVAMHGGLGGGISGEKEELGQARRVYLLNEYIRFDKPGTYFLQCRSNLVEDNREELVELTSEPVKILIVEPRRLNVLLRENFFRLLALSPLKFIREYGLRKLRFLGTRTASDILLAHFGDVYDKPDCVHVPFGLLGARDKDYLKDKLFNRIKNPSEISRESHIFLYSALCIPSHLYTRLGEYAVDANMDIKRHKVLLDVIEQISSQTKIAYLSCFNAMRENLNERKDAGLAEAAFILFTSPWMTHGSFGHPVGDSAKRFSEDEEVRRRLREHFLYFDRYRQRNLLADGWDALKDPAISSILEKLKISLQSNLEQDDEDFVRADKLLPLVILREMQASGKDAEARTMIMDEIKNRSNRLPTKILLSLPDEKLPELDDFLLKTFSERPDDITARLINRYGTGKHFETIIRIFVGNEDKNVELSNSSAILEYWYRNDPESYMQDIEYRILNGKKFSNMLTKEAYSQEMAPLLMRLWGRASPEAKSTICLAMTRYDSGTNLEFIIDAMRDILKTQELSATGANAISMPNKYSFAYALALNNKLNINGNAADMFREIFDEDWIAYIRRIKENNR